MQTKISFGLFLICYVCLSSLISANPVKITNDHSHSGFGYYNTCPESPDGQKIAYTKMLDYSSSDRHAEYPAELWICNRDLTGHEKIFDISGCSNHNFSRNVWIDNRTIALHDQGTNKVYIIDIIKKSVKFSVAAKDIGHNVVNGQLLLGDAGSIAGIYTFD